MSHILRNEKPFQSTLNLSVWRCSELIHACNCGQSGQISSKTRHQMRDVLLTSVCVSFRRTTPTRCSADDTAQRRRRLYCCPSSQTRFSGTTLLTVTSHRMQTIIKHAARHTLNTQFSQDVWLLDLQQSLSSSPSSSSFAIADRENKTSAALQSSLPVRQVKWKRRLRSNTIPNNDLSLYHDILFHWNGCLGSKSQSAWVTMQPFPRPRHRRFLARQLEHLWVPSISESEWDRGQSKKKKQTLSYPTFFKIINKGQYWELLIWSSFHKA